MRGLTPLERAYLLLAADPPNESRDATALEWGTAERLRRMGRCELREDETDVWHVATDLGRLALRVCPVDDA